MFSSAIKSFTSNISSNYSISPTPTSRSGPWKIYDAKKKSTGKVASVFVFEKKSIDSRSSGFGGRSANSSLKRAHDEVLERLKKEASSLARLRHPYILELVEPVEETRSGGLQFATEQVTGSLGALLDEQDRGGRSHRYTEEVDGQNGKQEFEIDELEIQKGLLQVGKALEFLHESAGLVHSNLTLDAIFVNAKSDWKVSGLAFCSPPDNSTKPTSVTPISLSEVLNYDGRLPQSVQLNLDFSSPDFVMDSNLTTSADMFSLGLLILALYNTPHNSPLQTHGSASTYKRLMGSPSSIPTGNNNFLLDSSKLPREMASGLLPRLITRRPAQRMTARELQDAPYFDNMLVSAIRFLDALPAKTPNEKSAFMRGLPRIMDQFPKSVLEKKVLPALLDETKDRELLSVILQDVLKIIGMIPTGKKAFSEKVIPKLREVFLARTNTKAPSQDRDSMKEAGLMVLLQDMQVLVDNTTGKEFKDDILPLIILALETPTHYVVNAAFGTLPTILPVLDFTTVKSDLFPVVASVFSRTNSMGIKIRGLEALQVLCGADTSENSNPSDGLDGISPNESARAKASSNCILDKYTVQEKVVPLLKAIKTKEPAVMMASLEVFKQVGKVADADFIANEVLPILWNFALGPLLNLTQFQGFMALIKSLSSRIETEQTRKLQSSNTAPSTNGTNDFMNFGETQARNDNPDDVDFESLVLGRNKASTPFDGGWGQSSTTSSRPSASRSPSNFSGAEPAFSWSSTGPTSPAGTGMTASSSQNLSSFSALTPTNATSAHSSFNQPLQASKPNVLSPTASSGFASSTGTPTFSSGSGTPVSSSVNWSAAVGGAASNPWSDSSSSSQSMGQSGSWSSFGQQANSSFTTSQSTSSPYQSFSIAPPPAQPPRQHSGYGGGGTMSGLTMGQQQQQQQQQQQSQQPQQPAKQGMAKYESLL